MPELYVHYRPFILFGLVYWTIFGLGCQQPSPSSEASLSAAEGLPVVEADLPFTLQFHPASGTSQQPAYRLEVRRNDEPWMPVSRSDFPYPERHTPRVSVTGMDSVQTFDAVPAEVTWTVVIRRWADGAVTNESGDRFAFRLVDEQGEPLVAAGTKEVELQVPEGHLGGTFVETPGRIGPWQADDGHLYFIMEPSETDNVLMMVRSADEGVTWVEVDGAHRPVADDLEGLASSVHEGIIHILHQQSEQVWYHAFSMTEEAWVVRDELVSEPGEPPVQVASLEALSDGRLVAFYGGPRKVVMRTRAASGQWGQETRLDAVLPDRLSGPMSVRRGDDHVQVAYTSRDGSLWTRTLASSGQLRDRMLVSARLDTTESGIGAVLPLGRDVSAGEVVFVYRESDGRLYRRRLRSDGTLSSQRRVSDMRVVQNAVDSDQTGADVVVHEGRTHVLFIEEGTGTVYYASAGRTGPFSAPVPVEEGVNAQWIRGQVLDRSGETVYGYVFDAGSNGGSGLNRYGFFPLGEE